VERRRRRAIGRRRPLGLARASKRWSSDAYPLGSTAPTADGRLGDRETGSAGGEYLPRDRSRQSGCLLLEETIGLALTIACVEFGRRFLDVAVAALDWLVDVGITGGTCGSMIRGVLRRWDGVER
jgi:hypothetical protein